MIFSTMNANYSLTGKHTHKRYSKKREMSKLGLPRNGNGPGQADQQGRGAGERRQTVVFLQHDRGEAENK